MLLLAGLFYTTQFLSQCGPAVAPATTRAIIKVESGGNPFAIGDNNLKRNFAPASRAEATILAASLIAKGHSVDLGLMQINSRHLVPRRLSLEALFDPCLNVRAGTAILAEFYELHRSADPAQSLFKALSAYNTGRAWRGPNYVNKVLKAAGVSYRVSLQPVSGATAAIAPVTASHLDRGSKSADPAVSALFFSGASGAAFQQ